MGLIKDEVVLCFLGENFYIETFCFIFEIYFSQKNKKDGTYQKI